MGNDSNSSETLNSGNDPIDFQVNRDDFRDCRFVPGAAIDSLSDGQVLFKVDRFALTSNNITYAAAGDMLNYWGFFPGPARWGRIPAMGFGDVIESRHAEVDVGARCFGFFPMSRHLVIDAKPTGSGMIDAVAFANTVVGIPVEESLRMAALYPATFLGLEHKLGRIANG